MPDLLDQLELMGAYQLADDVRHQVQEDRIRLLYDCPKCGVVEHNPEDPTDQAHCPCHGTWCACGCHDVDGTQGPKDGTF